MYAECLKKLKRVLYFLKNLSLCVSKDSLRTVYFALFRRILSSGLALWGNSSYIDIILRQVQKEALRCLPKAEFREHFKPLFVQVPVKWSIKISYVLFISFYPYKGKWQDLCTQYLSIPSFQKLSHSST